MNQRVQSINKDIEFVKLLDVGFDISQFFLVAFLSPLEASGINQSHMCQLLVLPVDLIPLPLETFPDLSDFFFAQAFPK